MISTKDMAFYYPNGEEIKKEIFLDFYSKCYYMNNNVFVEDEIEKLLDKGKNNLTEEDLFNILAWKIGKINHKKSNPDDGIIYYKDWNKELLEAKIYKDSLDKEFFSCIKKSLLEINGEELIDYINKLKDINHLGPVYIVTLRYFSTKGKYPIYDRFAYKAIQAILNNHIPFDLISEKNTLNKNINDIYNEYLKKLQNIFPENFSERKVDQALWVYGHLF